MGVLLCNKSLFIILSLERGIEKCRRRENNNLNGKYCIILKKKVLISVFHLPLLFNNTFYFSFLYFFNHIFLSMYLIVVWMDMIYENHKN